MIIHRYHQVALAPSTISTYNSGLRAYRFFCLNVHLPMLPLSEINLQRFVVSLSNRVSYKCIKVYLSGVQFWSILCGFDCRIVSFPRLFYLLRGVRRSQGIRFCRPRRTPITVGHLQLIHHRLQFQCYSSFQRLMLRTASSLAFFGLLRCSEYTSDRRRSFNVMTTLLVGDIRFNQDFTIMLIHLKASKTDPFREGCTIRVAAIQVPICPVSLMREYLHSHPSGAGPLFVWSAGHYLIREDIVLLLRRCFPGVRNVNTHSFRIGGASAAASAGIPDSQIQLLGRWSSDAYRRYLRLGDNLVRDLCQALASGGRNTRLWDSDLGTSVPPVTR